MQRDHASDEKGYGLGFEIRILLARANLLLEEGWREGRWFFSIAGLFIGLSLLDLWSVVPSWLHVLGLILFSVAALVSLYLAARNFRIPDRSRALGYLEARNTLAHRPLRALGDRSEAEKKGQSPSGRMWRIYQKSLRRYVTGLKVGVPDLDMGAGDSYGLRGGVILLLVAAFIIAGPRAGERLYAAVTPGVGAPAAPADVTAWITPPVYTGQAPILLGALPSDGGAPKTYVVPAGSSFIAHIFGGGSARPVLKLDGESQDFVAVDERNFQIEAEFDRSMTVEIEKAGDVIASWKLTIIPDEAPTAELIADPEVTERSAFRLQYRATDDYGVMRIGGEIRRENSDEVIELPLPTPGRGSKQVVSKSYHDLTAHPWAGLPVTLRLYAEDQIGQRGYSEPYNYVLPERRFMHPVARVLIEQRKYLATDPTGNRDDAALVLDALAGLPETYDNDVTVMLALATAGAFLRNSEEQKAVDDASDIMWETALRLENGGLSLAEAALRAAQEALMEALNRDASDEEIKRLMDELRSAMENFLRALAEQQPMEEQPVDPNSQDQIVRSQDLQQMLDRIEELARGGAKDSAREMLSQLQDMMENLRMARPQTPTDGQQAQQEMLNELGEMMRQQQQLLDQTYRQSQGQRLQQPERSQPGQPGQQGQRPQPGQDGQQGESLQDLSKRQEALRRQLGELMRRLGEQGEIPDALGRAERSMNEARDALQEGREGPAIESEGNALENLQQGSQDLAEQMMQDGQGQGPQQAGPGQPGEGRDPLGRSIEEQGTQGNVSESATIRGKSEAFSKSRDIRNELQRRLSDPARPVIEKDYLRRLLDIF